MGRYFQLPTRPLSTPFKPKLVRPVDCPFAHPFPFLNSSSSRLPHLQHPSCQLFPPRKSIAYQPEICHSHLFILYDLTFLTHRRQVPDSTLCPGPPFERVSVSTTPQPSKLRSQLRRASGKVEISHNPNAIDAPWSKLPRLNNNYRDVDSPFINPSKH